MHYGEDHACGGWRTSVFTPMSKIRQTVRWIGDAAALIGWMIVMSVMALWFGAFLHYILCCDCR